MNYQSTEDEQKYIKGPERNKLTKNLFERTKLEASQALISNYIIKLY